MADNDALRWLCHTEGYNEEGELDGDLLAEAILKSAWLAAVKDEARQGLAT